MVSKGNLDALLKRREEVLARLNAKIAQEKRKEDFRTRKEDTRHKIVVGACLLADMEKNLELRKVIEASLKRVAIPRDAEFLRTQGWKI